MDIRSARELNEINRRFYAQNAVSFSATRTVPWPGWEHLVAISETPGSVLDVACGNLRFERFLADSNPDSVPLCYCVDSCPELWDDSLGANLIEADIIEALMRDRNVFAENSVPECDLVIAFGFMHHVPSYELRAELLRQMCAQVKPAGYLCLSFWQFMNDRKLASKAKKTTERARVKIDAVLDEGDYLLGWQDDPDALRYCHHFTVQEVDALIAEVANDFELVERYEADGRDGALNAYVILRR